MNRYRLKICLTCLTSGFTSYIQSCRPIDVKSRSSLVDEILLCDKGSCLERLKSTGTITCLHPAALPALTIVPCVQIRILRFLTILIRWYAHQEQCKPLQMNSAIASHLRCYHRFHIYYHTNDINLDHVCETPIFISWPHHEPRKLPSMTTKVVRFHWNHFDHFVCLVTSNNEVALI